MGLLTHVNPKKCIKHIAITKSNDKYILKELRCSKCGKLIGFAYSIDNEIITYLLKQFGPYEDIILKSVNDIEMS